MSPQGHRHAGLLTFEEESLSSDLGYRIKVSVASVGHIPPQPAQRWPVGEQGLCPRSPPYRPSSPPAMCMRISKVNLGTHQPADAFVERAFPGPLVSWCRDVLFLRRIYKTSGDRGGPTPWWHSTSCPQAGHVKGWSHSAHHHSSRDSETQSHIAESSRDKTEGCRGEKMPHDIWQKLPGKWQA